MSVAANVWQRDQIGDLKRGAFAKLAAHVGHTDAEKAADAALPCSAQPVRLPRTSVRDPLPLVDAHGVTRPSLAGPLVKGGINRGPSQITQRPAPPAPMSRAAEDHPRLSTVGRLKMRANHPKYSHETHAEAKRELAAMGLTPHGKPKRNRK